MRAHPRYRDPGSLVGLMLAGVPFALVAGFLAQWWPWALWVGVIALLPAMMGGVYSFAALTMIPKRSAFWTGGIAVGALVGLLYAEADPIGAVAGAAAAGAMRLYAEAVTWVLARLGYRDPLDG